MSSLLQDLKEKIDFIDQDLKDTVSGYIHELEKSLSIENIPSLIVYIILAFYCKPNEYFASCGKDILISNNNMTISKIASPQSWLNTSYCNEWIDSTKNLIVSWTLKIDKNNANSKHKKYGGIRFGFVSHDDKQDDSFDSNSICSEIRPVYKYNASGSIAINGRHSRNKRATPSAEGDTIIITLDIPSKCAFIKVNDKEKAILFEDMEVGQDIRYKLAISIYRIKSQITLKSFSYNTHD